MQDRSHKDLILEQFTRQAAPFNAAKVLADERALAMIVASRRVAASDTVLDLACGGELVGCAFAPHVQQVTGIDVTPAMLDRARVLCSERGLTNVSWQTGDVTSVPFPDESFSVVVTRYSFHSAVILAIPVVMGAQAAVAETGEVSQSWSAPGTAELVGGAGRYDEICGNCT